MIHLLSLNRNWRTRVKMFPAFIMPVMAALFLTLLLPTGLQAAALTWDTVIAANGTIDAGSGTWLNGSGNWNNLTTSVGINWNNATPDSATFGGADGTYTVTVGGAITSAGITFANSGYTLSAASAQTITLGSSVNVSVAGGKSATIGNNVTATKVGGYSVLGGGTLNVTGTGAKLQTTGGSANLTVSGTGTKVVVGTGGTMSSQGSMLIGSIAGETGVALEVNGGDVNLTTTSGSNLILANGTSGSATITLTSGNIVNNLISGSLRFGPGGANSGSSTFHLNGGTLTVGKILEGATGHSSTFNFNGGTLKVLSTSTSLATFMTGVDTANVRNNGAIIDLNGTVVTNGQALVHSTVGGDNATDGGLTINDTAVTKGVMTLTSASTYTGPTAINAGAIVAGANGALGTTAGNTTVGSASALAFSGGINYSTAETIVGSGPGLTNGVGAIAAGSRGFVQSVNGSNTFAGAIQINATNLSRIGTQDGAQLTLSGPITMASGVSNVVVLFRAGNSNGDFITLANSGNNWDLDTAIFTANNGTGAGVRLGANNALPTAASVYGLTNSAAGAMLDLAGYNQMLNGLTHNGANLKIINSLSSSTSVLTLSNSVSKDFGTLGVILDGAGKIQLVKTGSGSQTLQNTNTYSGDTTISAGTFALSGPATIANTPNISVASGATFDVSARTGGFTLGAAQTLGGNGIVVGSVTNNGTIAAGASIGTLTFSTAPVLNGTIVAELNRTNSQTADKIAGAGAFGGTLTITNIGPVLQNGDTFDLFDGSLSGTFGTVNLPNGPSHWNTSDLNVGGTIIFTNASPVAKDITAGVVQGGTVVLPVVGGKNSATDADGDALSVTAVSTPGSGSASFGASNVTYVASGSTGTNTFTYTVTDSVGAADTKTVTMIVSNPQGFNQVSAGVDGGNAVLTYLGIPGTNYALEITHSLPATNWTPVISNTASSIGYLYFTNLISLSPTNDYYRTRYVP